MTMPSVLRFLALIALLFASVPSEAVELPTGLKPGGTGRVVEVVDGDTIRLADGREVRLVGIQAPKLPLGRPNFPTWPMAPEAKAALEELILRQEVVLGFFVSRAGRIVGARRDALSRAGAGLYLRR